MATIIFKPTEKCNSNCIYCYVVKRKKTKSMPLSLLEHIYININEFLKAKPEEKVHITWHGGEPLLLGADYFVQALEFQEKHCAETKHRIYHDIQSNLTLINEKFLDVFRKMGITHIGTSFEPISNIRGFGINRDSVSYNRKFIKSINLLEKNSFGWGFIYVINKKSLKRPLDLFFLLSNLKFRGGFMFNPVLIYGEDSENIGISPVEYADFLGAIFPVWWEHRNRYPNVFPFNSLVENIIEKKHTLKCEDTGRCIYNYVYIGSDGETSQCGRSGDWEMISYGNIKKRSLIDIMCDKQREQFVQRLNSLYEGECNNCPYWEYCHGGCPLESYIKHKNFTHKSYKCEGKKLFLEKYFFPITGYKL